MRLLIVEDYKPLRKALKQGLKEAGFAVDATGNGEEGLWFAMSNDYDAIILDLMLPGMDGIILDLMLPGMDGLTLLKKFRAEGRQNHVLILTAKDALEDKINGLNLGADDYLVKPFAFEELLARIRALTRRNYRQN
jgi:DNA-binding response OmpR family regulator